MRTVVHRNNNNVLKYILKRQNTVVPSYNNNVVPSHNNNGVKHMLTRQNTVVPSYNNNVVKHMLKRQNTIVRKTGGKRKTRLNKKVRKTRRSHKK